MELAWILFILYIILTSYLGWLGHKKTSDFSSFAIGVGDMKPLQVGVTLAAATASAATFIINPGFVYVDGLSAFMHYGVSVYLGIVFMLFFMSFKFRSLGSNMKALTIPDWIGKRYNSKAFAMYFSVVNLLTFAFIVLIVGGISIVMQNLLDINNVTALLITLIFVTGYVLMGGTYAHVFTNMFQGFLMIFITIIILYSGFQVMQSNPDFWEMLSRKDENLLKFVNPSSRLFSDFFSTYISGFLIGVALVCQPHILTKALYVKTDRAVRNYLLIFSAIYFLFSLLLLAGFWAHGAVEAERLIDPESSNFRQDLVMTVYLDSVFPEWLFTIISVVLLAAAMSTLDGLLVGISTITANDLVLNIIERINGKLDKQRAMKYALISSQLILVIIAILTFIITLQPPKLLGIFGQVGVYGLVIAALPPLLMGILFNEVSISLVWSASIIALIIHFVLYIYGYDLFPNINIALKNPGVTAAISMIITLLPTYLITYLKNKNI